MRSKITEQGLLIPKEFFVGIEEVEIHRENERVVVAPIRTKRTRELGNLKGTVQFMADDFDAPLEDFKEYMP